VLVAGVDADGKVFPYFHQGDRSAQAATSPTPLPNSVVLDTDTRPERIFAVCSNEPLGVDELRPLAQDALRTAGGRIEQVKALNLPAEAVSASVLLNKATR